jgi:plasmid stabilization system protein ParE
MRFAVRFTPDAEDDLLRLFDFLLERDLAAAARAERAIRRALQLLGFSPFSCRKAGSDPLLRELVVPFGNAGYVALFRIEDARTITILAIRHQRESDYH